MPNMQLVIWTGLSTMYWDILNIYFSLIGMVQTNKVQLQLNLQHEHMHNNTN